MNKYILDKNNKRVKQVFDGLIAAIREMAKGSVVEVTFKKHKKSRTGQQNAYFWMLVGLVANYTGQDKEEHKDDLMFALGHVSEKVYRGRVCLKIKSTKSLAVDEFSILIESAITLCVSLGIKYPKPHELGMDF